MQSVIHALPRPTPPPPPPGHTESAQIPVLPSSSPVLISSTLSFFNVAEWETLDSRMGRGTLSQR